MTELRPDKDSGSERTECSTSVPSNLLIAHGDARNEVAKPPLAVITSGSSSSFCNEFFSAFAILWTYRQVK
jgi:hypothetical protein